MTAEKTEGAPVAFPDDATNMQVLGPAMEIVEQADADAYLERMVCHVLRLDAALSREAAERTAKQSLGYWAGYYSLEVRQRVERLFRCTHPVFGSAEEGHASFKATLKAGRRVAEARAEGLSLDEAMAVGREVIEANRRSAKVVDNDEGVA